MLPVKTGSWGGICQQYLLVFTVANSIERALRAATAMQLQQSMDVLSRTVPLANSSQTRSSQKNTA